MKNEKEKIGEFTLWDVTYKNFEISDRTTFNHLPSELKEFYLKINGVLLFNGMIQIRGCVNDPEWISLKEVWTGKYCLHNVYEVLRETDIPIAQDCFGDQYIYREGKIYMLEVEIGDLEPMGADFPTFINEIISTPHEFIDTELVIELEEQNIVLKNGELFNVFPPFVLNTQGGRSFKPTSFDEQISYLMCIYQQIKDLPEGQELKFTIK